MSTNVPHTADNIISICFYLERKNNVECPMTEREAAMLRGFVAWKKSNWKKMKEADADQTAPTQLSKLSKRQNGPPN